VGQLDGKTAVVTGGTSGIGLATVARFASEGARVFVTGRRKDALDTAVATVGGNVTGIQGDVSKLADLDRLYAAVAERSDGIDVVFANAGGGEFATLDRSPSNISTRPSATMSKACCSRCRKRCRC
jgi:NAD(P)-dependent dehydrogenase (short-subunit alcohol dehydrogenase family)